MEKGRRGLAEVVGIRGEVAAPGKKLEETGFTRAEVLGGRKDKASQKPGRVAMSIPHTAPLALHPSFQPDGSDQKGASPNPLELPLLLPNPGATLPDPTSPTYYALVSRS